MNQDGKTELKEFPASNGSDLGTVEIHIRQFDAIFFP